MLKSAKQVESMLDFLTECEGVKPLKAQDTVHISPEKDLLAKQLKRAAIGSTIDMLDNYLTLEKVEPIDPYDYISHKQDGVQHGVFRNLRLGKYQINAILNIQQSRFEDARTQLFTRILEVYQTGERMMLVRHGLGLNSRPFKAFLKSYVNQWLLQMPQVIAFHTALGKHGGNSAVYVLLKKNPQQKADNSEMHRKK
jgi:DNA-nicking Smr family endonuclease